MTLDRELTILQITNGLKEKTEVMKDLSAMKSFLSERSTIAGKIKKLADNLQLNINQYKQFFREDSTANKDTLIREYRNFL